MVDDEKVLKLLNISSASVYILTYLVNDTLDFYQIKSGKFKPRPSNFKVKDIAENCFKII